MPTSVPCPNCGKAVPWAPESRWRPFCSERCRLIDLGDWFDEAHRIAGEPGLDSDVDPAVDANLDADTAANEEERSPFFH
ncbi:DNA gyrase inhibitor YacG [Thiorhodovibrio winogradskyi]|uniref:DNA gyrase inhibitor YacG n=1 Tax=Thiorhodovibrio winogradskyi TaxID=77007 RepID=A0ABZ0SIX1_9GAMM|nr:DNA gyrase inhibitor YacG [Thiorhodovibrio winogradskyi]